MLQSRLLLPSVPLRPFIHHFWVMRADAFPHEMSVMPRGCSKWIFHRMEPFVVNGVEERGNIATVCGQYHTLQPVLCQQCGYGQPGDAGVQGTEAQGDGCRR